MVLDGRGVGVGEIGALVLVGANSVNVCDGPGASSSRSTGLGVGVTVTPSMLLEILGAATGRLAKPAPAVVVVVTGRRTNIIAAASAITTSAAMSAVSVDPG